MVARSALDDLDDAMDVMNKTIKKLVESCHPFCSVLFGSNTRYILVQTTDGSIDDKRTAQKRAELFLSNPS